MGIALKDMSLALALLVIASPPARAQKTAEQSKTPVYNMITGESFAWDRDGKRAYAAKFRIIDIRQTDGFAPGRMKGHTPFSYYRDPRPEREEAVPAKVVLVWVVTPEGGVIEPRILHSTDKRVADYLLKIVSLQRYAPARLRGSAVYSIWGHEFVFGSDPARADGYFKDGLGIQGQRDR